MATDGGADRAAKGGDAGATGASAPPLRVLVTGATGRLGQATCEVLCARGFEVRATDRRFRAGLPVRVEVGDLRDESFVYRVVEGVDAVVHLGNHPNPFAGPSPQVILAENVAMNANVFYAGVDLGISSLVFASSIQVFLCNDGGRRKPPHYAPYFPLDGAAPRKPGLNAYALSKELGERLLEEIANEHPQRSLTAVRFPMLPNEQWFQHVRAGKVPPWGLNEADALSYLDIRDAGSFIAAVLARPRAGYRQYFPALTFALREVSPGELARTRYPEVPVRRSLDEMGGLVDLDAITAELDWRPEHGLAAKIG